MDDIRSQFEYILLSKLLDRIKNNDILKSNYQISNEPILYTGRLRLSFSSKIYDPGGYLCTASAELYQIKAGSRLSQLEWLNLRIDYKSGSQHIDIWGLPVSQRGINNDTNPIAPSAPFSRQVCLYEPKYEDLVCDMLVDMWLDHVIRYRSTII